MAIVRNIVLVGKLSGNYNSKELKQCGRFNGSKLRLPNCTCLIFANGALTVVGVKSLLEVKKIPHYLSCSLPGANLVKQENGNFLRICNIVATSNFGSPCNLHQLFESHRHNYIICYTPETFPGMKFHLRNNLVAIVFHTGKIVITGAKSMDEINFADALIHKIMKISYKD